MWLFALEATCSVSRCHTECIRRLRLWVQSPLQPCASSEPSAREDESTLALPRSIIHVAYVRAIRRLWFMEWEGGQEDDLPMPDLEVRNGSPMLQRRNDDAGHRVERAIESWVGPLSALLLGALLACSWPAPDGFDPRGSSGHIRA
jgi:hypothetical protein